MYSFLSNLRNRFTTQHENLNGRHTKTYDNNDTYDGEFVHGLRHGQGVYTHQLGHKYDGQWSNDCRHGVGMFTYAKESAAGGGVGWSGTFDGQWSDGEKHGRGWFLFVNGDKYEGQWYRGRPHGFGIHSFANKDRYEGQHSGGLMHGYGIYYHANGDCLIGRWREGKQDGPAVWTSIEGVRREERWRDGRREWQSGAVRETDPGLARQAAMDVLEEMVRVDEKEAEFERRELARRQEEEERRRREEVERLRRLKHEQEEREEKERIAHQLSQLIMNDFKPLTEDGQEERKVMEVNGVSPAGRTEEHKESEPAGAKDDLPDTPTSTLTHPATDGGQDAQQQQHSTSPPKLPTSPPPPLPRNPPTPRNRNSVADATENGVQQPTDTSTADTVTLSAAPGPGNEPANHTAHLVAQPPGTEPATVATNGVEVDESSRESVKDTLTSAAADVITADASPPVVVHDAQSEHVT